MINTIIISDIKIYREGLRQLLSTKGPIDVIDTAATGAAAIASITSRTPQVVLLDMTTTSSCELAAQITQLNSRIKIVALAITNDEPNIIRYAKAGITCYVPREGSIDELVTAISEAAKGSCYCPPEIAALMLNRMRAPDATTDCASK